MYRHLIYSGVVITYQAKNGLSVSKGRRLYYSYEKKNNKFEPQISTIIKNTLCKSKVKVKGKMIFKNLEYNIRTTFVWAKGIF